MTKLRLPLNSVFDDDEETTDITRIKQYTKEFINNTFKELKDAISSYHSVKEIESRKKLSAFFKQKICDFELFDILLLGVECFRPLNTQYKSIQNIEKEGFRYEDLANNLAIMFESMKQLISPSFDVQTAIQSLVDYRYLLPSFDTLYDQNDGVNTKESVESDITQHQNSLIDYDYIDRLYKIYLTKESTLIYDDIIIKKGVVYLHKNNIQIEVVLCGDINDPKWKLLSIRENDKIKTSVKALVNVQDNHKLQEHQLLDEFMKTVRIVFTNFNFSEMAKLLRIYEAHSSIFAIYNTFKKSREHCDLTINGGYKKFIISIDQYVVKIEISKDGLNILCEIKTYNNTYSSFPDIISFLEEKISESLYKNSYFKLESGYIYCVRVNDTSKTVSIDDKVGFNILKTLTSDELETTKFKFRTKENLNKFVEDITREIRFYRKLYKCLESKYLLIRDYKKYGEHNIIIKDKKKSLVITLVSLTDISAIILLYVCSQLTDGVTQIVELKMSYNDIYQCLNLYFDKGTSQIKLDAGIQFIKKNIELLLSINKFHKYRKNFRLSHNIHIDDIEIESNEGHFKIFYNGNIIDCFSVDDVVCKLSFKDFMKTLSPFIQSSHPKSNLFLLETTSYILNSKKDNNYLDIPISFSNLISFYIQKNMAFLELHYKGFNVTLSYSNKLIINSTNIVVTEMFKHFDVDFFSFVNFLDRIVSFVSYNLMPTVFTPDKLLYNFKTHDDFFLVQLVSNGYSIVTKTKIYNSKDPQFDLESLIEDLRKRYNEDRYNRAVSVFRESYTIAITSNYIECKTPYVKLRLDPDMKLKIIENISQIETNELECYLNERITLSDDFEVFRLLGDLNKINNMKLSPNK